MPFLQVDFFSETLGLSTSANVILPQRTVSQIGMAGTAGDGPPPVLWLLHGRSDDHTIWMRRSSIERYAATRGLAVIMPNAHRSFYRDMAGGFRFNRFFREELPILMADMLRISTDPADQFIAGLSMGGYGALLLALQDPGRYAAAVSLSGVVDPAQYFATLKTDADRMDELTRLFGDIDRIDGSEGDLFHLVRRLRENGTPLPQLMQVCGTEDFLYEGNLRFRDFLRAEGVALTYEEEPGAHTWDFFDRWIERAIAWLPLRTG